MKTVRMPVTGRQLRQAINDANGEPVILTERGRPLVAMVSIKGCDRETISLSINPKFLAILRRSFRQLDAGQGIGIDEMRRRLGITRRATKKVRMKR